MADNTQGLDEILQPIRNYADIVEIDFAREQILDWHNKQVGAVLDRIHQSTVRSELIKGEPAYMAVTRAINTERNKLKETSNDRT